MNKKSGKSAFFTVLLVSLLVFAATSAIFASASSVYITPKPTLDSDNIVCHATGGCAGYHYIYWYRNSNFAGSVLTNAASVIDASLTAAGDTWACQAFDYCSGNFIGQDSTVVQANPVTNTAPVISPNIPNVNLSENSGFNNDVLDLWVYVTDSQSADNLLSYVIISETNTGIVDCTIDQNRYIDCTVQPNMVGYSDVRVRITDPQGAFAEDVFSVIVSPMNQLPVVVIVSPISYQQFALCENITLYVNASDNDGSIQSIVWTIDGIIYNGNNITLRAVDLGVGTHLGSVVVTDNVGGSTTLNINFTILTHTNPVVAITQPINTPDPLILYNFAQGTMMTFDALASPTDTCSPYAGFQYIWRENGVSIVSDDQTFSLNNLTLGTHNITVYATDGIGGEASASININITQQPNTCPTVQILAPASTDIFADPCQQINFSSSAADADGSINSLSWIYSSSIINTQSNFSLLASYFGVGTHTVAFSATDNSGCSANTSVSFNVAPHQNPTCTITMPINDPDPATYFTYPENSPITFTASAAANDACVPQSYSWIWRDNSIPIVTDSSSFTLDNLSLGPHNMTVYATDGFGGECYDTILINISDTNLPPVATILTPFNDQLFVRECELITFTSDVYDQNAGGSINSLVWQWNGITLSQQEDFTVNASTFNFGNNTVTLTVTDNEGVPASDSVTFNVVAHSQPAVIIVSPGNGSVYIEGSPVTFSAQANPTDACQANYDWIWTNNQNPWISGEQTFTLSNLSAGLHEIRAYAYDQFGQSNYSRIFINITDVPNIPPAITSIVCLNSTGGPRIKEWDPIICNAVADDPDGIITSWIWSVSGPGTSIGPNSSTSQFTILEGLNDGNYTVSLMVLDNGTPVLSATDFIDIQVFANIAPVVVISSPANDPQQNMEFCSISFDAAASDIDGYILQPWDEIFTWNIAMANGTTAYLTDNHNFTYLGRLPAGYNMFTVSVTDDDGATGTDTVTINTTSNIPPTVQIMLPITLPTFNISEGNNISFSADIVDGDQDDCSSCTFNDYNWAWFDEYNGVTTQISTQRLFNLIRPGIGIHRITVTGTDCYGASNIDTITVNVTEVPNNPPVVTISQPADAAVDYYIDHCENVPFNATAIDPDGDNINAWMWNYETLAGVQTMTVPSFTVNAMNFSIGNHTAYAYAFDNQTPPGLGSDSITFQIREHSNPLAAISSPLNGTQWFIGTPINFSGNGITTDRCNANTFSWIWTEDGNIMSTSQDFSSYALSLGWHKVTLFITDQYGHSNSTSIYINITEVPNADPIVTITSPVDSAAGYYIDHCDNIPFNATAIDPDGDDISAWMWNYETMLGLQTRTIPYFTVPAIEFSIGNHTANVYAFDNRTTPGMGTDSITFNVIEHTNPVVSIVQPLNGTSWLLGSPVNFTASASATDRCNASQFSWIWTENGNPMGSQQSFTTSTLTRGWHKVNVFVTDQYGHSNSTFVWLNITELVNMPPVISGITCYNMTNNTPIMEFENFYCFANAFDTDGNIISWIWDIDGDGVNPQPATDTFVAPVTLANGTYNLSLTVVDNGTTTPPLSTTYSIPLVIANNRPNVTLTPANQSGNEPYNAVFTCSVSGGNKPYIYSFNFGNGVTDVLPSGNTTSAIFNITYVQNGTYTVSCNITDMDGDIGFATGTVTIGDTLPAANFNFTPSPAYENQTITFTDLSTWTNDPIVSWFWDFGDGTNTTSSVPTNPTHRYAQENPVGAPIGSYTVTLTVVDSDGSISTFTQTVNVLDTVPQAWITAPATAVEGTNVTFVGFGLAYDSPSLNYSWNFGDGGVATGNVVGHVFAQQANRTVSLTVTDNDGSPTTVTHTIIITDTVPTANAGPDQTVSECSAVQFNGSLSTGYDQPLTYGWDFGNGDFGSGAAPLYAGYATQGTYLVNLTVTDLGLSAASDTLTVTVLDTQPIANAGSSQIVNEGQLVNFDASATIVNSCDGPLTYIWYFGDGSNTSGITTTHTYNTTGDQTFTVTLVVNDTDGSTDNATITIFVNDLDPVITSFTAAPNPVNESSQVSFSVIAADNAPYDRIANYAWNFGDGSAIQMGAALTNPVHTYADNGTYNVTVTVSDEDSSTIQSMLINVLNVAPTVAILGAPYTCMQGTTLYPVSAATDPAGAYDPLTYAWDYDYDNITFDTNSTLQLPALLCDMPVGIYALAVRAYDGDGGMGQATAILNITTSAINNPPQFTPALMGQFVDVNATLMYDINATDPDGDAINFTVDAPYSIVPSGIFGGLFTFVPTNATNYTVNVTICDDSGFTNACTNGTFVIYAGITNLPPIASFIAAPSSQNEGSIITFDASASTDPVGTITTYTWNFGDGNTGAGQVINHTYTDNGIFTVNLTVTDNGGLSNSTTSTVTIFNVAPAASIIGGGVTVNEGSTVSLSSTVSDAGTNDTFTYEWDLGTGTFVAGSSTAVFNATNNIGSPFTIKIRVTDDDLVPVINTTMITVNNLPPTAVCYGPYTGTEGIAALFNGNATDPGAFDTFTYEWDMSYNGSGFALDSSLQNPSWIYTDNFAGTVALRVRDNSGALSGICTAAVTISNANPAILSVTPSPNPVDEGSSSTITVIATDVPADQGTLLYDYDCNGDGTYEVQNISLNNYACSFNDNPGNTVNVRVKDKDGGIALGSTAVIVNNVAPTANAGGPYACTQGTPISFSGSATDPAGAADTLFFAWDYDNNGVYNDAVGQTPFYPCSASVGLHTIGLNVSDGEGGSSTVSTTVTISAAPVNNAPVFNPALANQNAVVGVPFTYDINATDVDAGQVLNYTDNSALFDINLATGMISFTPTAGQEGVYSIMITVCDNSTFVNACTPGLFTLTISAVANTPPTLTGLPDQSYLQGSGLYDNVMDLWTYANDLQDTSGTMAYTIISQTNSGLVNCVVDSNRYIDCTTPAGTGFSDVTVRVTDTGGLFADDIFRVNVSASLPPNVPPTANAGADQSVLVNTPVALNGAASTDDGLPNPPASLTYSWSQVSGTSVVITGSNTAAPTFTSPSATSALVFNMTVYDGQYYASDLVTINVYTVTDSVLITGPIFKSVPGGATITTTPMGSTFDIRLTIDNMIDSTLTGVSSTITLPAGFNITSNSDGTTSATISRNLDPMGSITINWRVTAPMTANTYAINTNTAGVVKTNSIQVI